VLQILGTGFISSPFPYPSNQMGVRSARWRRT